MLKLDRNIIAVIEDWVSGYEGNDPERVIDLYTDDAVVAVQGRATVNGHDDIAALLRDSFKRYDRTVSVRYDRAEIQVRWAYVHGRNCVDFGRPHRYSYCAMPMKPIFLATL